MPSRQLSILIQTLDVKLMCKLQIYSINIDKQFFCNKANFKGGRALRRYAANDKIFKLFFLHPFLASTIYNNTIKKKFDIW